MFHLINIALLNIRLPFNELVEFNILLSVLCFTITLVLFLFILVSRLLDGLRSARIEKTEEYVQLFLSSFINGDNYSESEIEDFRSKYVLNYKNREIVVKNLLSLHKNLLGEAEEKLKDLYLTLGLHKYSKQKLYSTSWHVVSKGIGELAEMKMSKYSDLIKTFINHPHPIVRSEAQVAILKLKKKGLFALLHDTKEPLLDWQQLQLARAASKAQLLDIPDFNQWLNSSEDSVVLFSLRMISYYGQHNALHQIFALLKHPSEKIREEAIIALKNLESFEAIPVLTSMYKHETVEIQLKILKALSAIGGSETLPFYESLLHDTDKRLQLEAAKAIYMSSHEGKEKLKSILDNHKYILQSLNEKTLTYKV